jgi:hypothetical protein
MSSPQFESKIPVRPPTVNKKIKPNEKINGVYKHKRPRHKVASQLNTLTPVGQAMIAVAAV